MASSSRRSDSEGSTDDPIEFTYDQIISLVDFTDEPIGRGGYGSVYKGEMDWREIAIKRTENGNIMSRKQYTAERKYLQIFKHQNIVKLLGYGEDEEHSYLVLEYVPHTLSRIFFDLSWNQVLKFLRQSAVALSYIHEHKHIFGDFKTANILIDQAYDVKLCDFGGMIQEGEIPTANTAPYTAPEIKRSQKNNITTKADVYSFGVMLLQLVMKVEEKDIGERKNRNSTHIADVAANEFERRKHVVDKSLMTSGCTKAVALEITKLGVNCTNVNHHHRPNMNYVLHTLEKLEVII